MVETKERQEKIDATTKALDAIAKVDASTLSRKDELSRDINFAESVPHLERMLDVFRDLHSRDISRLPTRHLDQIVAQATALQKHIDSIRNFSLTGENPAQMCANINNGIAAAYDGIVEALLVPLSFTATQQTNYAQIEREAKGHNAELKHQFEEAQKFIKQAEKDARNALAAVQEQAAQAGVSTNAQVFNTEANDRAGSAKTWLKATVVLTSVTALAAVAGLVAVFYWTPESTPEAIQYVVSKLIVLSVLTFATVWCARNYRSQKHNETLNRHRAHALMTFNAFVEGTADPHVKDTVLVEASQAAFRGRPTGYEQPGAAQSSGPTVGELIRTTMPRIGPSTAIESS